MKNPAIEVSGLCKFFPLAEKGRYLRAVDDLSLRIEENSVFGLLGPNGSGKSTTVRILLGLSKPSEGQVRIFGEDPSESRIRSRIGYLPDAPYYHKFLTGKELMNFFGKLKGIDRSLRNDMGSELLCRFGLEDAMDRKLGTYSKGMLQRLGFAQCLMGDPDVLVLDEPTAGVDPIGAAEVGEFVSGLKAAGKTVLLCSHLLTQVQELCDHVGILNKGRLLANGRVNSLLVESETGGLVVENLDTKSKQELRQFTADRGGTARPQKTDLESLFRRLVVEDEGKGK